MQLAGAAEINKHYLELVDAALFVLCLDHTSPSTAAEVPCLPHISAGVSGLYIAVQSPLLKHWLSEYVFGGKYPDRYGWFGATANRATLSFFLPWPSRRRHWCFYR